MKSKTATFLIAAIVLATLRTTASGQVTGTSQNVDSTFNQSAPLPNATYRSYIEDEQEAAAYSAGEQGYVSYVEDTVPEEPLLPDSQDNAAGDDAVGTGPLETSDPFADDKPIYEDCPVYEPCSIPLLCDSWFSLEYMNAYTKGRHLPPLLTSRAPGGTPPDGLLPGSPILFGGEDVGNGRQSAGRLYFGTWIDANRTIGLGGRFMVIEGDRSSYHASANGVDEGLLARPFYNTNPIPGITGPDSLIIADDGIRSGAVNIVADNELLTAEALVRRVWLRKRNRSLELIGGYHYARIDDSLAIDHQMTQVGGSPSIPVGTQFNFSDVFDTQNEFHGGSIGILAEFNRGPVTLSIMTKASLGNMHQRVKIMGGTDVTDVSGVVSSYDGALLALPTNMNVYEDDVFGVIPEADIKLIWHASERIDLTLGYSFVYWNSVALAGDQIEVGSDGVPVVNNSQVFGNPLIGPANPVLPMISDASFWLQGITVGFTINL